MAFTFNGIGTCYYGRRDEEPDGSYIATAWFVFFFIPIVPLASFRVWPLGTGKSAILWSSKDLLVEQVPLCWPQIWPLLVLVDLPLAITILISALAGG